MCMSASRTGNPGCTRTQSRSPRPVRLRLSCRSTRQPSRCRVTAGSKTSRIDTRRDARRSGIIVGRPNPFSTPPLRGRMSKYARRRRNCVPSGRLWNTGPGHGCLACSPRGRLATRRGRLAALRRQARSQCYIRIVRIRQARPPEPPQLAVAALPSPLFAQVDLAPSVPPEKASNALHDMTPLSVEPFESGRSVRTKRASHDSRVPASTGRAGLALWRHCGTRAPRWSEARKGRVVRRGRTLPGRGSVVMGRRHRSRLC
jgi:hypothetical protein